METIITLMHDHSTNELVAIWGGDSELSREIARGPHGGPETYAEIARKAGEWLVANFD